MPSKRSVGVAPLLAGVFLAGAAALQIKQAGVTSWLLPSFVGGCATAIVGIETIMSARRAEAGMAELKPTTSLILLGLAGLSFVVGISLAVA